MSNDLEVQSKYFLRSYNKQPNDINNFKRNKLHADGYDVFRGAIKVDAEFLQLIKNRSPYGDIIFNHNEITASNDKKRLQTNLRITTKRLEAFDREIKKFVLENVNTELNPTSPVILHSKPGCQPQAAHCDYVPDKSFRQCSDTNIPLALIVCLMDGTTLRAWPKSARLSTMSSQKLKNVKPIYCKELKLSPGDILVFRGDFVHAGSAYDNDNYRIHYYLDSPLVNRRKNETWLIGKDAPRIFEKIILPEQPVKKLRFAK